MLLFNFKRALALSLVLASAIGAPDPLSGSDADETAKNLRGDSRSLSVSASDSVAECREQGKKSVEVKIYFPRQSSTFDYHWALHHETDGIVWEDGGAIIRGDSTYVSHEEQCFQPSNYKFVLEVPEEVRLFAY